jgi:hypothetical protein
MKHFIGVGGVQNSQSGCYRRMPLLAPIKGGIRRGAEQLVLHQHAPEAGYPQWSVRELALAPDLIYV